MNRYQEIWVDGPNGQSLCALVNGDQGWLMYLRYQGDDGFSSCNPDFVGADAEIDYELKNGQQDWYPSSWALPLSLVNQALDYFRSTGEAPPFITWHNDGGESGPVKA
jgi:hypothetical protein